MHPLRLVNDTFPNSTIVKADIKEMILFRGQDWLQKKLYTYDSFATNKKTSFTSFHN